LVTVYVTVWLVCFTFDLVRQFPTHTLGSLWVIYGSRYTVPTFCAPHTARSRFTVLHIWLHTVGFALHFTHGLRLHCYVGLRTHVCVCWFLHALHTSFTALYGCVHFGLLLRFTCAAHAHVCGSTFTHTLRCHALHITTFRPLRVWLVALRFTLPGSFCTRLRLRLHYTRLRWVGYTGSTHLRSLPVYRYGYTVWLHGLPQFTRLVHTLVAYTLHTGWLRFTLLPRVTRAPVHGLATPQVPHLHTSSTVTFYAIRLRFRLPHTLPTVSPVGCLVTGSVTVHCHTVICWVPQFTHGYAHAVHPHYRLDSHTF